MIKPVTNDGLRFVGALFAGEVHEFERRAIGSRIGCPVAVRWREQ